MRPSRFFARTPQPAGHSRQTVANHEATPGTICSFGTTSGRMDSVACWQPPVAAAAPDAVTILKKSRRFIYRGLEAGSGRGWRVIGTGGSAAPDRRSWVANTGSAAPDRRSWVAHIGGSRSMVACHAVERRLPTGRYVLSAVAVDAPTHRERRRRGPETDEIQEVVRQAWPRLGGEGGHGLDRPMACLTPEARAHVRLVREVGELGKLVDSYPGNRFLLRVVLGDLLDLRQGRASDLVAAHTALDGRQPRVLRAARLAVAVLTVDLVRPDVNVVGEVDRLAGWPCHGRLAAPRRHRQEHQDGEERHAECAHARLGRHRQSIALRGIERCL